jgi:hypothetical protein
LSIIGPNKRISREAQINHTKTINKMFEGAVRTASYRPATKLLRLIQNMIEIANTQPQAYKIFTNKSG